MLRSRIIPCLLIRNGGLVKTIRFGRDKYVGDPLNAVRIFNEKEVDEIVILDIDAGANNREPNYSLIEKIASECRMPLCYGGGITHLKQVERIISLGVEKVAISSAFHINPNLVAEAAARVGSQSVVIIIDVKQVGLIKKRYEVFTNNGTIASGVSPVAVAEQAELLGAGEILINSIDRDGTLLGYDFDLIDQIYDVAHLPVTALGGAGSVDDIASLLNRYRLIGAAAGSLFVLKGKYRAVLIQYPSRDEKELLVNHP